MNRLHSFIFETSGGQWLKTCELASLDLGIWKQLRSKIVHSSSDLQNRRTLVEIDCLAHLSRLPSLAT